MDSATHPAAPRFDADLIRRYGGRGPRYTSYPTALQFHEDIGEAEYRENARASNASGSPLSIYVHIPFCRTLCYYCGCNKIVTRNEQRVARYLTDLEREIEMQSELFDADRQVMQMHFGGGTPTYLDTPRLARLIGNLDEAFSFGNADQREFSIEIDPRTVDSNRIAEIADLGFNRLSLGIQDFNPEVQRAVNRMQTLEEIEQLLGSARNNGFRSVSFDLIYGLPQQTRASFEDTLQDVIGLRPDRLAVYNYAHLPERFKGQRMIDADTIPSADEKLEILDLTIAMLTDAGYEYVGMDHFALPDDDLVLAQRDGTLQRNFQGYSTYGDCDLIGLGVSSIGSIGTMLAQNSPSTAEYQRMIEEGHLPIVRGVRVDDDDRMRAEVIQALMCFDDLDTDRFGGEHAIDFDSYFAPEIERLGPLTDDGLITFDDKKIRVTSQGRLLLRSIAMVFDRHLNRTPLRYSKLI